MKIYKSAFTLAEVLITLTILGIVAIITIPSILHNNQTKINKTRLKKAFANYEKLLNQVMIENNLGSNERIDSFASNNDCINTRQYFKTVKDGATNCRFMTSDKLWWDITDLRSTTVAFKEGNLTDGSAENLNSTKAFKFISGFEDNIFMVNSIQYLGSKSNFAATKNLIEYVFGKVNDNIKDYLKNRCSVSDGEVFSQKNNRTSCYMKPSSKSSNIFIYDENGILKYRYSGCNIDSYDVSTCKDFAYFTNIDKKNGNWLATVYNIENKNLVEVYLFINNNPQKAYYRKCNTDGTNCQECYNSSKNVYEPCQD